MRPGLFEFHKQATIVIITGRMGSGKTTLARKLKDNFDEFFQTDLPRPMNKETGKYDDPTKAEKVKIRAERLGKILKADDAGKRVLVEGHPPGVIKLFKGQLGRIDHALLLPLSVAESFQRVLKRALDDPAEYDALTEMDSAVYNNKKFDRDLKEIRGAGVKLTEYDGPKLKTAAALAPKPAHQEKLDEHFTTTDGDRWSKFRRNLRSQSFSTAVRADLRSDDKLKRYAENIHRHLSSRNVVAKVTGDSGKTYTIKYHPDVKRHSCSCGHWVNQLSAQPAGDCKHIAGLKPKKEKKAELLGQVLGAAGRGALLEHHHEAAARQAFVDAQAAKAYRQAFPSNARQRAGDFLKDTSVLYQATRQ